MYKNHACITNRIFLKKKLVGLDLISKRHLLLCKPILFGKNIINSDKLKRVKHRESLTSLLCQANHKHLSISFFFLLLLKQSHHFNKMSNSTHRRRAPTPVGNGGRSIRMRRTASRCVSDKNRSKSTNQVFELSFSDSSLNRRRDGDGTCMRRSSPLSGLPTEESGQIVYLPRIRSEVMASSPSLLGISSPSSQFPTNQEVRLCFSPFSLNYFLFFYYFQTRL